LSAELLLTSEQAEKKAAAKAREVAERAKKDAADASDVSAGAYGKSAQCTS